MGIRPEIAIRPHVEAVTPAETSVSGVARGNVKVQRGLKDRIRHPGKTFLNQENPARQE